MPVYLPGLTFGKGYGGAAYGYSPYGGGYFPRSPVPVTGGYGGAPFSFSSYGNFGTTLPSISSAVSVDGFNIRVFFSEEMLTDPNLTDATNYSLVASFGVPVTVNSITVTSSGPFGATSVTINHSGTTLGGRYQVTAINLQAHSTQPLTPPNNTAILLSLGDVTSMTATPDSTSAKHLLLSFFDSNGNPQPLLPEVDFSPGTDATSTYRIDPLSYPITPVVSSAEQQTSQNQVLLELLYMTSKSYNVEAGPSLAFDYTGNVLPEDSTDFTGTQIGVGTGTSSVSGLFLSKSSGTTFGYSFGDTSGRMLPNSTFRADITFDASSASISPLVVSDTFATFSVSDGVREIAVLLRDISGSKIIEVVSGTYSSQIPCNWDSSSKKVSVIRNQKADFYTILVDDRPEATLTTSDATGTPTVGAGCAFVLSSDYAVSLFKISEVKLSSTQTLFTNTWNFIHSLVAPFTGSGAFTRNVIKTKRGPLVRGWGDNTIAKKEDVRIYIDGTEVSVAAINPYIGEIYPQIPIPVFPAGLFSVTIDYIWFQNPSLPMLGLNTQGLTLNTWDRPDGHTSGAVSPLPAGSLGVAKTNRFPMGITLGPGARKSPKHIGHRYIGFQDAYSALLNKESLLVLNKNPNAVSDGYLLSKYKQQTGVFNGRVLPSDSETPWNLSGADTGALVGDGTYRVVDASSGSYSLGYEAYYYREIDLTLNCVATEISRLKIESYTLDGVFTGVGFGLYEGHDLCLIGALYISGVQHFGLLRDASNPHLEDSWEIGFKFEAEAFSQTLIKVPYVGFPTGVEEGDRIRVAGGSQAGVYTIASCGLNLDVENSLVEITLEESLPANISSAGDKVFKFYFETKWDSNLVGFRVVADFIKGTADVFLGSEISGTFLSSVMTAYPAQTALLLPVSEKGSAFWGSLSRKATSSSVWDIVQYLVNPSNLLKTSTGISVNTDMTTLPEKLSVDPWYIVSGFGTSKVDSGVLLLKSNSSSTNKDTSFYYQAVEPFLSNKVETNIETFFGVSTGNTQGDGQIIIRDGVREATLKTLRTKVVGSKRYLITKIPVTSLSGLLAPQDEGWTPDSTNSVSTSVQGKILSITKTSSQNANWKNVYTLGSNPGNANPTGAQLRAKLKINSGTSGTYGIGLFIGCHSYTTSNSRQVSLGFDTGTVYLTSPGLSYVPVVSFSFDWNDGQYHEYRVEVRSSSLVKLFIDDIEKASAPYASFFPTSDQFSQEITAVGTGAFSVSLASTSCVPRKADVNEQNVYGVLTRYGNPDDIDGYVIPRTDSLSVPNSDSSATPMLTNWTSPLRVRVYLDPLWGVSVYLPNFSTPTGKPPFSPPTNDPQDAWINVEYGNLPVKVQERGSISFGSPDPASSSIQVWDFVNYTIKSPPTGFGIAPQGMVLNRATKLTSGEFNFDTSLEDKTFNSRTTTLVYLPDSAIYADTVFKVFVDGVLLSGSDYSFDSLTQYLVLSTALPKQQYPVRVIFSAAKPETKTYLCDQPLSGSVTKLNEGTPPVLKSRDTAAVGLYSGVEYCTKENGDSLNISTLCDGPGPGKGLSEIGIDGNFTSGSFEVPHGPGGVFGKSSPTVKGSSTHFDLPIFHASGGNYRGGNLGPATMILYPNQRGVDGEKPTMGMNQDFTISLESVTPYADSLGSIEDNVPPSSAEPIQNNPDGTAGTHGNGAAAYIQKDFGLTVSRIGPWGGLSSLSKSLLSGGSPLTGNQFILQGGAHIAPPTETTGVLEATS